MTNHLKLHDIISISFMTFALFVGAGNIIFPLMVGLQAGEQRWIAAVGFLITAVGLPVLTIISIAKAGSNINNLNISIGKVAGGLLATVCHLTVGPLFAIPRTATVSFEVGISSLIGDSTLPLFIYSLVYFTSVIIFSLYPGKLLDTIGNFLAPLKIIALIILSGSAIIWPAGRVSDATDAYQSSAFINGFLHGYLTMDTLGAMVFSVVVINAMRSRGVTEIHLLTRYAIYSALIAGIGITLLYLALFHLGASSSVLIDQNANGAEILNTYVKYTFGNTGRFFLAALIFFSCLSTSVGLTSSCAEFFSQYTPFSYRMIVIFLCIFSIVISNLGLSYLIQISIPVLTAIYPPYIVLVLLSFTRRWWYNSSRIIALTMLTSLIFGIFDGIKISVFSNLIPIWIQYLPLSGQGMIWIIPTFITLCLTVIWDYIERYHLISFIRTNR